MVSISPPSSSHDNAATIVAELITTFGCVLGLSDSILCSSSISCHIKHPAKIELITTFGCVLGLSDSILCSSSKNGGFLLRDGQLLPN